MTCPTSTSPGPARQRLRDIGVAHLVLEDPAWVAEGEPAARPASRRLPRALATLASPAALAALPRGGAPLEEGSAQPGPLAVDEPGRAVWRSPSVVAGAGELALLRVGW